MKDTTTASTSTRQTRREQAAYARYVAKQLGPQQVGGVYRCGYWDDLYEVLAIDAGPDNWQISVRTLGEDRVRTHCTGWDHGRDQVVAAPGLAADAWRAAYTRAVTPGDEAAERHVLDGADRLFHQLAPGYAAALTLTLTTAMEASR